MGFLVRLSSKEENNLGLKPVLNNELQTFISDFFVETQFVFGSENVQKIKEALRALLL